MKMTSFYYLAYPDCSPADPLMASSEVYIEISDAQGGDLEHFSKTFAITVCTLGFLNEYLKSHPYYTNSCLVENLSAAFGG